MKRLGKYSGKVYEENEIPNMEECGIIITDDQSKDERWIKNHHAFDLAKCVGCKRCPLYIKTMLFTEEMDR